jgi:hypothetical protein
MDLLLDTCRSSGPEKVKYSQRGFRQEAGTYRLIGAVDLISDGPAKKENPRGSIRVYDNGSNCFMVFDGSMDPERAGDIQKPICKLTGLAAFKECYEKCDPEANLKVDADNGCVLVQSGTKREREKYVPVFNALVSLDLIQADPAIEGYRDWFFEVDLGLNVPEKAASDFRRMFERTHRFTFI